MYVTATQTRICKARLRSMRHQFLGLLYSIGVNIGQG